MPSPPPGASPTLVTDRPPDAPGGDVPSCRGLPGGQASASEGAGLVGVVRFPTHRGAPAAAVLGRDGHWRCAELPVLDRVLNTLFEPRRWGSAGGPFGVEAVRAVAGWLRGATVELPDADARPTGGGA